MGPRTVIWPGLRRLFAKALALWQRYHAGTAPAFAAQATSLRQRLDEHLRARVLPHPDSQCLADQLRWHHQRGNLLRFLDDPRIEPTNNRAERALRPAVIARKVSQCSKAPAGAEAFAAFATVLRTAIQQRNSGTERLIQLRGSPRAGTC
jgi:transposase